MTCKDAKVLGLPSPARQGRSCIESSASQESASPTKGRYIPPHRRHVESPINSAKCFKPTPLGDQATDTTSLLTEEATRMDEMMRHTFLTAAAANKRPIDSDGKLVPGDEHLAALEAFIRDHHLDDKVGYSAGVALRDCEPRVQLAVIEAGGLHNARNPAATVMARIRNESPGIRFPVKGTRLYVLHMRPLRVEGSNLDVKRSSFKSLGNFFKSLESEGLLSLKPHVSDPVITSINWEHPDFKVFLPSHAVDEEATKLQHVATDEVRTITEYPPLKGQVLARYTDPESSRIWFWHASADLALYEDELPTAGWSKFFDEGERREWWWNEQTNEYFFHGNP